jgi:hypothetical protein
VTFLGWLFGPRESKQEQLREQGHIEAIRGAKLEEKHKIAAEEIQKALEHVRSAAKNIQNEAKFQLDKTEDSLLAVRGMLRRALPEDER